MFYNACKLFKKYFWSTILLFSLAFVCTLFFSFYSRSVYTSKAIIFTTTGVIGEGQSFDHVQGAAYFAETIQGWTKNPVFIDKVLGELNTDARINAYKQERQNMVIEIHAKNKQEASVIAESFIRNLSDEVERYNTLNKSRFHLMNEGIKIIDVSSNSILFVIIASLIAAIITVSIWIWANEHYKKASK